jgi:hypothetical protein
MNEPKSNHSRNDLVFVCGFGFSIYVMISNSTRVRLYNPFRKSILYDFELVVWLLVCRTTLVEGQKVRFYEAVNLGKNTG